MRTDAEAVGDAEAEADTPDAASADPVRTYLREMTSFSLLTRESEVAIAKRIEDGQRRVLRVVLGSSSAMDEIVFLGAELRHARLRVKDVVRNVDSDDPDFDEQWHVDRICKVFDKVARLRKRGARSAASRAVGATRRPRPPCVQRPTRRADGVHQALQRREGQR